MRGMYQHCAEKHIHRYLAEFDFYYNNRAALGVDDGSRAETLAAGIAGKRLTYRGPHQALTKPEFKHRAARFMHRRKKQAKSKRKFVRYWQPRKPPA